MSEINDEVKIWTEVEREKALEDYIQTGGSVVRMLEEVCHDVCFNFCKYGDLWGEDVNLERPEPCKKCPLDRLGNF